MDTTQTRIPTDQERKFLCSQHLNFINVKKFNAKKCGKTIRVHSVRVETNHQSDFDPIQKKLNSPLNS